MSELSLVTVYVDDRPVQVWSGAEVGDLVGLLDRSVRDRLTSETAFFADAAGHEVGSGGGLAPGQRLFVRDRQRGDRGISMDTTATYTCSFCGEESVTEVDISQGWSQRYVEDCQVCCRPMVFHLVFDEETGAASIETAPTD